MGRENQLAWMWALDGARHTLEIASWRVVSRRVRGSWGWSWGCGVRLSVVALAPVWCGPRRELATPLKCQLGALKGFADAAEWHWIEN